MKRTAVASACIAAFLTVAMPHGLAHGTLKAGKWWCYVGTQSITSIHFKSNGVYITPVGSTSSKAKGKWSHNPDKALIRFNSGPLDSPKYKAKHVKVSKGTWAVDAYAKVDGDWGYSYSCGLG